MIVATAGHVDHGKTSLVKQLTGVNTDRLEEEQRRGLSISLGFAYRKPSTGGSIGFIDVPGHRRFINTMISGISGVDIGMLVVDANDGVMPQTLEHINVMRLLGVTDYTVVITKIDRTDRSMICIVRDAMMELLPQCKVFEVSNISGEGIEALQAFLDQKAATCQAQAASGYFRLSIDRAFVLKGAGLVVTGTVTSGRVEVGDTLQLLAANKAGRAINVRVRSIHAHDEPAQMGCAGQRCALNIVGDIDRQDIQRGDYLSDPRCANPSERFDARLQLVAEAPFPLKHLQPVKLYIGARCISAKVFFLDNHQVLDEHNELSQGSHKLVQFILKDELLVCWGDRFLIQDDSESVILGGGVVLNPGAPKWRKSQAQRLQYLTAMALDNPVAILEQLVLKDQQVIDFSAFRQSLNLLAEEGEVIIQHTTLAGRITRKVSEGEELLVSKPRWQEARERMCQTLQDWHAAHPIEQGMKIVELQQRLGSGSPKSLLAATMTALIDENRIVLRDGLVGMVGHRPTLLPQVQETWMLLENLLTKGGFQIPLLSELEREEGLNPKNLAATIRTALKVGDLYQVGKKRFALPEILRKLAVEVNVLAEQRDRFSVIDAKKHLNLGRDLTIEILEYFDSIRFTQRKGDGRIILDQTLPEKLFKP